MAMEKGTHRALWVMASIGGLIILWLLMRGKASSIVNGGSTINNIINGGSNTPLMGPNSYNISSPGSRNWVGGASGLPNIAPLNENDCGCTSINGGNFFTSINDMLNQFMTGARGAFNNYESNVFGGYPTAMTQYFNNPVGANLSATSANSFNARDSSGLAMDFTNTISGAN